MEPDRAKKALSRIPQLAAKSRATTRRTDPPQPGDGLRPSAITTRPAAPARSKPAPRLGSTTPRQGAALQGGQAPRKATGARDAHAATSATATSREGSLLRKSAGREGLARHGLATRQGSAASGRMSAGRPGPGPGLARSAVPSRPGSSSGSRSVGGTPVNKWNASVAMTPSAAARPGPSDRFGTSREAVTSKKVVHGRDATGARPQPGAGQTPMSRQEVGTRLAGALRRPGERQGEGSVASGQPRGGLRKPGALGQGSAALQQPIAFRRAPQGAARGLQEGKAASGLGSNLNGLEASQGTGSPGQMDGTKPRFAPQQQGVSALMGATSVRVQGTSQVREAAIRSTWADPASSDSFRSMLTSPGRSSIRSPDRSSSMSTDEISDGGEQPPPAAEHVRNSSNPFITGTHDGNCAFKAQPRSKDSADNAVKPPHGQALCAQLLVSGRITEPSSHPDMDAETSFTGSEQSNEHIAFSPSGRVGEEEMRRRPYRGQSGCISVCSEGGFSDELAMREDSRLSFALESVPSTFEDSDEDVPTGRHSVSQNSTQRCATAELPLKGMKGLHARPKSVDCLQGSQGASGCSFPSRNELSSPYITSPLKMPSLGPVNPERLGIDLSAPADSSVPSGQSEGDSKSASLLSIGSVNSPMRVDDGTVEQHQKEIEALRADNSVLTAQIKDLEASSTAASEKIVSGLKQDLQDLRAEKAVLLKGTEAMKLDKQRLQAELKQSQDEVMCVLSETRDADAEVQKYLRRLEEAQSRNELLERNHQQAEGELCTLQKEHGKLQERLRGLESAAEQNKCLSDDNKRLGKALEAEAKAKTDALDESQMAAEGLAQELKQVKATLQSVLEENALLKGQPARSPKVADALPSSNYKAPEAPGGKAAIPKVAQLQGALSLALQMSKCLKDHMEQVTDRSPVQPDGDHQGAQMETEAETMRKVKELEEALELALEAQDLLEKRVAEQEGVHPGLEQLDKEVQNLKVELDAERSKAQEEQEAVQAMIQELENDKAEKANDLQQMRQALDAAVAAKATTEAELAAEKAASLGLRKLLEDPNAAHFPRGSQGLRAARQVGLAGSPPLVAGLDADSSDGAVSPLSAAKLRTPAEFGDERQLRRAAIAAVTRLEEMEQELSNAVQAKCDLAQQMMDISVASQELQKVVLETAQITSEMSMSKDRRGGTKARCGAPLASADDPLDGIVRRSDCGDADGDFEISGASDGEDVSIPAGRLRGLRVEIRRALQEKGALEAQLAERDRKTAEFGDELKGLQEQLKAALAMKEDLSCKFQEHEDAKAALAEQVARLGRELEEERASVAAVEEAVGALYFLCKEVEAAAEIEALGKSKDDDFPGDLPEAVLHITDRVREGICALAARGQPGPPHEGAGEGAGSDPGTPKVFPELGCQMAECGRARADSGPTRVRVAACSAPVGPESVTETPKAGDAQAQMADLQEALAAREHSCLGVATRPMSQTGSQVGSPMCVSRQSSRFGYVPARELHQRTQQLSLHQDVLQRQTSEGGARWREVESPYLAPSGKEGELRQLQDLMRDMELEIDALKQKNLLLGGVGGQGSSLPTVPDDVNHTVVGLQSKTQELETHLLQVKIENAELKKAIDQVNGIARGRSR